MTGSRSETCHLPCGAVIEIYFTITLLVGGRLVALRVIAVAEVAVRSVIADPLQPSPPPRRPSCPRAPRATRGASRVVRCLFMLSSCSHGVSSLAPPRLLHRNAIIRNMPKPFSHRSSDSTLIATSGPWSPLARLSTHVAHSHITALTRNPASRLAPGGRVPGSNNSATRKRKTK